MGAENPGSRRRAQKQIVGSNFVKEVFDDKQDVLLQVHAPWCGHCKKLKPEYNKLAAKVETEEFGDLLKILHMDGTLNESPVDSIEWTGFPTIYFVKAGKKEATVYEGERTAKALWKYVKKHSSHAATIQERIKLRQERNAKAYEL